MGTLNSYKIIQCVVVTKGQFYKAYNALIYEFANVYDFTNVRVFVFGKPLQPSPMFVVRSLL